jgi:hypothetical protein
MIWINELYEIAKNDFANKGIKDWNFVAKLKEYWD